MEAQQWKTLVSQREKCITFLQANATEMEPMLGAYQEICEIESLLGELWKRLEMHARKTRPTNQTTVNLSLPHNETLARRWIREVAIPLTIAANLFEEEEEGCT